MLKYLVFFLAFPSLLWAMPPEVAPIPAHFIDADIQYFLTPAPGYLYVQKMTGTLVDNGTTPGGRLNGIVFDYTNDWQGPYDMQTDNARVRPIIGQVTTTGPGSVRFVHGHARATEKATGALNVFAATVSAGPVTTTAYNYMAVSSGEPGVVDGFRFEQNPGSDFRRGLSFLNARFTKSAIDLSTGPTNGLFRWCVPGGKCVAGLWVDDEGIIHLVGTGMQANGKMLYRKGEDR